jgi:hypothetical protein
VALRNRRIRLIALSVVPVLGFAFGAYLALTLPGSSEPERGTEAFGGGPAAQVVLTPSPPAPSTTATESTSGTSSLNTTTPRASLRPRDRTTPTIGKATSEYGGIWTDFWCSAGPTTSKIVVPVQDRTDPASALKVHVRFVLHREDGGTLELDEVTVAGDASPFTFQLGPYPGPNDAYAYNNVLDMVVTATDRSGNKSTRAFASFVTFNDCKA